VAAFVRVCAVLVGIANVFLVSLVGEGELGNALMWNLDPWWPHNALYALCAVVAGLVVSSILLRFARRELRNSFFAR
jgi:ABC-type cobalamin transport system permease subunit